MEYRGEKRNGEFHGKGKLTNENGDIYEGDFQFGEFHGYGKFIINNDLTCEGKWIRGELIEGSISSKIENFLYKGEIRDLKRYGKGIFFNYTDQRRFEGYWKNDVLEESEDDWEVEIIE